MSGGILLLSITQSLYFSYRLRNDLYCVGWGVKLYSIQSCISVGFYEVISIICGYIFYIFVQVGYILRIQSFSHFMNVYIDTEFLMILYCDVRHIALSR